MNLCSLREVNVTVGVKQTMGCDSWTDRQEIRRTAGHMHITHSLVCFLNSSASSDGNTTLISLDERGFCNIGNAYRYLHNCRQVAIFPGVRLRDGIFSVSVRCLCLEIQTRKAPLFVGNDCVMYDDHLYTLNKDHSSFHSCHLRRYKSFHSVVEEPEYMESEKSTTSQLICIARGKANFLAHLVLLTLYLYSNFQVYQSGPVYSGCR